MPSDYAYKKSNRQEALDRGDCGQCYKRPRKVKPNGQLALNCVQCSKKASNRQLLYLIITGRAR